MKTMIIMLLALVSMSFTGEPEYESVSDKNIVYLYGDIEDGTIIQVFAKSYGGSYLLNAEFDFSENYILELNPTVSYQLWFTSPNGYKKIIYVEKGKAGVYHRNLDISFDEMQLMFFHMYQKENVYYLEWSN